jgi:hypothetical protein
MNKNTITAVVHEIFAQKPKPELVGRNGYTLALDSGKRFFSQDVAEEYLSFLHYKGLCQRVKETTEKEMIIEDRNRALRRAEEGCPRCRMDKRCEYLYAVMKFDLQCNKSAKEWELHGRFAENQANKMLDLLCQEGYGHAWKKFCRKNKLAFDFETDEDSVGSTIIETAQRTEKKVDVTLKMLGIGEFDEE